MKIKKQHEEKVKALFKMAQAGPSEIEIIKELTSEYISPLQTAATCWTCPGSIQTTFKMLCKKLDGYEIETDDTIGQENTDGNSKKRKKGADANSGSSNI